MEALVKTIVWLNMFDPVSDWNFMTYIYKRVSCFA